LEFLGSGRFSGTRRSGVGRVEGLDGQFRQGDVAGRAEYGRRADRLAGAVDAHHDQARFTWELGPDGDAIVIGFDVAQRDADGRLALVLGFLDKVPSA
jgi:hypothetical protein